MIRNADALDPDYLPRELHHREGQRDILRTCLWPVRNGLQAENACVFGPSGSGKTTIARHALERADTELAGVRWGYANCLSETSITGVLHQIITSAELDGPLQRQGASIGTYLDAFRNADEPVVAVIDEAYVLDERSLLASLYKIRGVSWIAIAIDEASFFVDLDPGIDSKIRSARKIRLERYSVDELLDILDGRIDVGLDRRYVERVAVEEIADRSAGNARDAIAMLRQAAYHVQAGDADRVSVDVVEEIEGDARQAIHDRTVESLGTHQRLLFEIIRESESIASSDLHEEYEDRSHSPRSRPTRRRYLRSLEGYDLIESSGSGRGTRYKAN